MSAGGKCQDAIILVEEVAVTLKPLGAFVGATIEPQYICLSLIAITVCWFITVHLVKLQVVKK